MVFQDANPQRKQCHISSTLAWQWQAIECYVRELWYLCSRHVVRLGKASKEGLGVSTWCSLLGSTNSDVTLKCRLFGYSGYVCAGRFLGLSFVKMHSALKVNIQV